LELTDLISKVGIPPIVHDFSEVHHNLESRRQRLLIGPKLTEDSCGITGSYNLRANEQSGSLCSYSILPGNWGSFNPRKDLREASFIINPPGFFWNSGSLNLLDYILERIPEHLCPHNLLNPLELYS
jgi:hypothetical protein